MNSELIFTLCQNLLCSRLFSSKIKKNLGSTNQDGFQDSLLQKILFSQGIKLFSPAWCKTTENALVLTICLFTKISIIATVGRFAKISVLSISNKSKEFNETLSKIFKKCFHLQVFLKNFGNI